ncbi:Protein UXT-like [Oopsacas minuta]|uniref:Protein UXT-like n=1 Tax=Oopsacas minuta TaxID=111878 RepID=A0AAV7K6H1_9METZ|nr:Protein UXT-like [Oopsacas minuta]
MAKLASTIVTQYETFLNEKLRGDLENLRKQLDCTYQEIAEYLELQLMLVKTSDTANTGFKTRVDIGCNFYVRAQTDPVGRIMICVGLGLFTEMEPREALDFIEKKIKFLEERVTKLKQDSAKVKANIKIVLGILRELQFGSKQSEY